MASCTVEAGLAEAFQAPTAPNGAAFLFNIAQRSDGQKRIDYVSCWQVTREEHWSPIFLVLAEQELTAFCHWCWWLSMYKLASHFICLPHFSSFCTPPSSHSLLTLDLSLSFSLEHLWESPSWLIAFPYFESTRPIFWAPFSTLSER